ncbi:hypothetical protein FRC03_011160 [Tulasnella sp. 419]|nr:hypothetical protein FRC02_004444 [Tulasnella sp. 418]KAG8970142.1 hypothetical protein FRC03_011160 [Tulasnella sp. 419]
MTYWSVLQSAVCALGLLAGASNALTLYQQIPGAAPTDYIGPGLQATAFPAFDPIQHTAPAAPVPPMPTGVTLALATGEVPGLSKKMRSDYVGISIELSIANRILGRNATWLNPEFLNHLQNLRARSGSVSVRLGGNSQEKGTLVPSLAPWAHDIINKTEDLTKPPGGTAAPIVTYSEDLLYAMSNISSLVNVGWYFGLPFLNEAQITPVANSVSSILGPTLQGLQSGNEPDLYLSHLRRKAPYGIPEFIADWGRVKDAYLPNRNDLIAPSVCCSWSIDDVLAQGFLTQYGSFLKFVSVQHYRDNNCPATPPVETPQQLFEGFLTHQAAVDFMLAYRNASNFVNAAGKELVLFETNTASCGGFAGTSDSFGAGLYLIDLALQGASIGISQVLFHNGGLGQYYNLFTPPPGNQTAFRKWTTSSPYYSTLIMAEVMSKPGSQVVDLGLNNNNPWTPGYAIYHEGQPNKVALFNFVSDASGANDLNVAISVGGGSTGQNVVTASQISVKYFYPSAGSTADKFNLTWAGQTMGDQFESDGRLKGTPVTETIQCVSGVCNVPVKAPGFALVFLTSDGVQVDPAQATVTFAATVATDRIGSILIDPQALATSNGRGGAQEAFNIGGTSFNKHSSASTQTQIGVAISLSLGMLAGLMLLFSR